MNARELLIALRALYVLRYGHKRKWRYWVVRKLGISYSTLADWRHRGRHPNAANLRKLQHLLESERSAAA